MSSKIDNVRFYDRQRNASRSPPRVRMAVGTDTARLPRKTSLEEKLELLEARFTKPLNFSPQSEATLGPMSSPTLTGTMTASRSSANQHSQHSFGFDSPSTMHRARNSRTDPSARKIKSPTDKVASSTTLDIVNRAAERHIAKIMANEGGGQHLLQNSSLSYMGLAGNSLSSGAVAASDSSNPTRLTAHLSANQHAAKNTEGVSSSFSAVVKESPPPAPSESTKGTAESSKPRTSTPTRSARLKQQSGSSERNKHIAVTTGAGTKRKAVPVKRELPSVKENFRSNKNLTHTTNGGAGGGGGNRKRAREMVSPKSRHSQGISGSNSKPPSPSRGESMHSRGEGKVSKHAGTKNQTIVSGENHSHHAHAHAHTNTRIHDFFKKKDHGSSTGELATVSSPNEIAPHGTKSTDSLEKEHGNSSNSDMELSAAGSVGTNFSSGKGRDRTQGGPTSSSTSTVQLEELERRCQELERSCKDKDEQLKAVSNNRTILHTALQRSLNAREKELESIKAERERDRQERAVVLENLVRLNATREAKELREKLALDGARLGRIVYARAGMRSVETWEDGHASKQIHDRIDVLKKKRARVEERYRKATKIANIIFSKDGETTSGDAESEDNVICGIHVETKLDAIEALESAKFHLSNVVRKEKELRAEEDSLNDEKTAHIRALKRVASEDASRFRSRPKVRRQALVFGLTNVPHF